MSGFDIATIIDKKDKTLPKPYINRPGFDMKRRYVDCLVPKKEPSNAQLAWNSLPNDNTPDDKKFLDLTRCKVKNPQTREQFNQWCTKWILFYKNNPMMRSSIINRQYKEYYIPD
ncbi:hypothetical protein C2G38_2180313 [Gigaspora rosea]|uniref:Uncharacterized protein n=1 Tax=Gigaspora rosea TaxID=44941 RepID=A0A397VF92_9GLOM|nr:hypothetical protein C2G38_2180313 [Gigaspora rosea]